MSNISKQQHIYHGYDAGVGTLVHTGIERTTLSSRFKGQVLMPDSPEYAQARTIFPGGFEQRPAVIIRVADAEDVKGVVCLAQETGLELAIRSGGHNLSGYSLTEGGIVLDLRNMKALHIDPMGRAAWAETGLTTGEYTTAADKYDLATGFGDAATVGIGGITLGGGVGYLVRKHGLTIDDLLAAEIVTADGQLRHVDAKNEPDLFWAIRGGGGNFGVATRLKLQLHEMGEVFGGMLILPTTPKVVAGFMNEAEAAPEELSTIANIMPAPPMPFIPPELYGKMILMAMMVHAGRVDQGIKAVAPFRKLAKPLMDMLKPMRYPEMFTPEEGDYHPTMVNQTMFLDTFDRDTARITIDTLRSSKGAMHVAQLRVLGGAMGRVHNAATAYAHRHRRIMATLTAFYTGAEDKPLQQSWVSDFAASLDQGEPGAYVNFLSGDGDTHAAYPEKTWMRLAKIKAKYDPTNLFHLNQNIPPA
jgi:FAD binding domain/Berberine and berberine like